MNKDFYPAIYYTDKIIDCIPIASTVKNTGILLYKLCHKVNAFNPMQKVSFKEDLKIIALSKDSFSTCVGIIPVIGNIVIIIQSVIKGIKKPLHARDFFWQLTSLKKSHLPNHSKEVLLYFLKKKECHFDSDILCELIRMSIQAGNQAEYDYFLSKDQNNINLLSFWAKLATEPNELSNLLSKFKDWHTNSNDQVEDLHTEIYQHSLITKNRSIFDEIVKVHSNPFSEKNKNFIADNYKTSNSYHHKFFLSIIDTYYQHFSSSTLANFLNTTMCAYFDDTHSHSPRKQQSCFEENYEHILKASWRVKIKSEDLKLALSLAISNKCYNINNFLVAFPDIDKKVIKDAQRIVNL